MICYPHWYFPLIFSPFPFIPFHYFLYSPNEWDHIIFILLWLKLSNFLISLYVSFLIYKNDILIGLLWECKLVQPLWTAVWSFLKRLQINETPGHLHPDVYSSNGHGSQTVEGPRCPTKDEWIKKMWFMYTMEYYSAIINDEYVPFASMWIELEGIMLSEVSKSEKDNHHMVSFIWGI